MNAAQKYFPIKSIGRFLLISAVCCSVGLHWAALQVVAWTSMVVTYAQRTHFTEAVEMTLNGEHPCNLCSVIKQEKEKEKRRDLTLRSKKMDAVLVTEFTIPSPISEHLDFPAGDQFAAVRDYEPIVPPPRV